MISPLDLVHSNSQKIFKSEIVSPNATFQRVQFGVYATILKSGLLNSNCLTYPELIENIPTQYYPCPTHMVDTFTLSTMMMQKTYKEYINHIDLDLSESDEKNLLDLFKMLPLTQEQCNMFLVNANVIEMPISADGLVYLLEKVTKKSISKSPISLYDAISDTSTTRHKRNSKPSVFIITNEQFSSYSLKSHFAKVIRAVRGMNIQFGFVVPSLLCAEMPLMQKKINKFTPAMLSSILSSRAEYEYLSDKIVVAGKVDDSEFIKLLSLLVKKTSPLPLSKLLSFFIQLFEYKTFSSKSRKRLSKKKFSLDDISKDFDVSIVSKEILVSVIALSDVLTIKDINGESVISIKDDFKDTDYFDRESYWYDVFLSYLASNAGHEYSLDGCIKFYVEFMKDSFERVINEPNGFFNSIGDEFSVDDDNVIFQENRSGEFIQPDLDIVTDEITYKLSAKDELENLGLSNFSVYEEAFNDAWKPKKGSKIKKLNALDLYYNEDYIKDFTEWMTHSRPKSALNLLRTDIETSTKNLISQKKRLAYIESNSDQTDEDSRITAIENTGNRISQWQHRIDRNNEVIECVLSSELSTSLEELDNELLELYAKRKSLRIKTKEFECSKIIHDYILSKGRKANREELMAYIEDYLNSLSLTTTKDGSVIYRTLYNMYTYHPFNVLFTE